MPDPPRILAFAGSARGASLNKRLLRIAAAGAEAAGVPCTLVDLRDHPLPIYDGDLEASAGLPGHAVALRELFHAHQGLLIASPEYNGSIPPLLKNTIDWVTRAPGARADLSGFAGKLAGILAASPGPLGGLRGLAALRSLLSGIGCTVVADQVTVGGAARAFTAEGRLADAAQHAKVEALGGQLARLVRSWCAEVRSGSAPP